MPSYLLGDMLTELMISKQEKLKETTRVMREARLQRMKENPHQHEPFLPQPWKKITFNPIYGENVG